jgi:hypothetical protein
MLNRTALIVAAALMLSICPPATAQTGSERPFHGQLFGSHQTQASPQALDISAYALEAYDDNLFATLGPVDPTSRPTGGFYTMLSPSVEYRLSERRFQVGIAGVSALGYYPDVHQVQSISHNFAGGFTAKPATNTTILLNQTASYSPSYLSGLFPHGSNVSPGDTLPDSPNYAVNDVESYSYGTTATITHGLTERASAQFGGNYRYTNFTHETLAQQDQQIEGFDSLVSYQRSRNIALRLSYHYLTGNVAYGGRVRSDENRLAGGISHSRAVSASRQMIMAFNVGSSALSSGNAPAALQVPDRLYRVSADASLDYPFARFWRLRGDFRRGLELVPALAQPVYANSVNTGLDGLLSRRIEIGFGGGYSQGRSALSAAGSQYDTYTGSARFEFALTNNAALHVEYFYYFYDFVGDVLVVSGAPQRLQRNGARVGLRLFVPAFRG